MGVFKSFVTFLKNILNIWIIHKGIYVHFVYIKILFKR